MANRVRIATFAGTPFDVDHHSPYETVARACLEHWRRRFDEVLPDQPHLLVLPEYASVPRSYDELGDEPAKLLEYCAHLGDRLLDLCRETARAQRATLVCSQLRRLEGGRWYNASTVIGPDGGELGVYCKNHLYLPESTVTGCQYGTSAELIAAPFGKLGCAICFDLNFEELRHQYERSRPDLLRRG